MAIFYSDIPECIFASASSQATVYPRPLDQLFSCSPFDHSPLVRYDIDRNPQRQGLNTYRINCAVLETVDRSYLENTKECFLCQPLPKEKVHKVIHIDGGLISQQLMLVAHAHGDTVPMGGYDADKLKEAFGIGDCYIPIMLIALGKAAKAGHPTMRLPGENVTFFNEMPAQ